MALMNAVDIFVEPSQVMTRLRHQPRWVAPFVVYTLGYMVVTLLMQAPTLSAMLGTLPKEYAAEFARMTYSGGTTALSLVAAVVSAFLRCGLLAGVLWLIVLMLDLDGSDRTYARVFTMCVVCSLVLLLRDFMNVGVIYVVGTSNITHVTQLYSSIGLDRLLGAGDLPFAAFRLLNAIDPFFLWYLALIYVGLRRMFDASRMTAGSVTGVFAVVSLVAVYALAALQPSAPPARTL